MKISLPTGVPEYNERDGFIAYSDKLRDYLKQIIDELRRFSDKGIDLRQNCRVAYITVTSSVVDGEIAVAHNLGITPFMYLWDIDRGGTVYDSRRADWTSSEIFVKCSVAAANIRITVFG